MLAIRRSFRFAVVRRIMRRFYHNYRSIVRLSALISIGFIVGFSLTMCFQTLNNIDECNRSSSAAAMIVDHRETTDDSSGSSPSVIGTPSPTPIKSGFVFIGVMTAKKFLSTRATVINQTWAQSVPGQMAFFVGDNVALDNADAADLPMVRLPRVDDSYPPQKKSFLMLKYMYDNYLDQFEWFIRADDDVYLRMDKLEVFLRSLNSSRPLYVGQAGLGTPEEYGMLNLGDEENYCMGGPGIVMSRETVKRVGPHIKECLKNLYTTHEDVELGRCVKRYADVSCTWSYEMQSVFYNNQSGSSAYSSDLNVAEVHHAITLHPVKQPVSMRKLHNFVRRMKISDLRFRSIQLNRDVLTSLKELELIVGVRPQSTRERAEVEDLSLQPSLLKFTPKTRDQIIVWDYLTPSIVFCTGSVNCPRHNAESYLRYALADVVRQTMDSMNKYARQRGRILVFQDILYGYRRVDPLHGAEYVLDILLMYKKFKGRRVSIPVRRHAYLQQNFAQIQMIEDGDYWKLDSIGDVNVGVDEISPPLETIIIHFVLPLSGRPTIFKRFLTNFERLCLPPSTERTKLTVVLFQTTNVDEDDENLKLLNEYRSKFGSDLFDFVRMNVSFSRGLALNVGAARHSADNLMFFTDVDVIFNENLLRRIRLNTVRGRRVYFPIVYSEYDPRFYSNRRSANTISNLGELRSSENENHYVYDTDRGYFRHFGFGLVSLFKSDYDLIGGFDLTLKGWGMEDVDLFDKFVKYSNLSLFRSPEPDLVHVYHPMECAKNLNKTQYDMCLGSKGASLASLYSLAEIFTNDRTLADEFFPSSSKNFTR